MDLRIDFESRHVTPVAVDVDDGPPQGRQITRVVGPTLGLCVVDNDRQHHIDELVAFCGRARIAGWPPGGPNPNGRRLLAGATGLGSQRWPRPCRPSAEPGRGRNDGVEVDEGWT
jgi:hypothetical protein